MKMRFTKRFYLGFMMHTLLFSILLALALTDVGGAGTLFSILLVAETFLIAIPFMAVGALAVGIFQSGHTGMMVALIVIGIATYLLVGLVWGLLFDRRLEQIKDFFRRNL